jgi:hypothetical protein
MNQNEYKVIVQKIFDCWKNDIKDDAIILGTLIAEFGLSINDAEWILERVKTAAFRASIISTGSSYPKNNLENDPVVKEALELALRELELTGRSSDRLSKQKSWWMFWK